MKMEMKTPTPLTELPRVIGKAPASLKKAVLIASTVAILGVASLPAVASASISDGAPSGEFNSLRESGNRDPEGIWSDGTTMWVSDSDDAKIYAYSMSTKDRYESEEFNTLRGAGNNAPRGIWSDGQTMWVADASDHKVYAYSMTTKQRDGTKDFDLWNVFAVFGNITPKGIWSDGETIWVADDEHVEKIYAYSLETGLRAEAKEIGLWDRNAINLLGEGNAAPQGIWSNGQTMWVADEYDQMLYAYSMNTNERLPHKEITALEDTGIRDARGIWSDGETMWVADARDDKIYSYSMPNEGSEATLVPMPVLEPLRFGLRTG